MVEDVLFDPLVDGGKECDAAIDDAANLLLIRAVQIGEGGGLHDHITEVTVENFVSLKP